VKRLAHLLHFALVLALACAPFLLHLAIWAPALVAAGHNGMAVLSLMGAAVWFGLWLQALPVSRRVPRCTTCAGRECSTPDACQLPIARATRPPRVAFWLDVPRQLVLRVRILWLRWCLLCASDDLTLYADTCTAGYARRSRLTQLDLMGRIRELEERLC
jgi:hypothetical protein